MMAKIYKEATAINIDREACHRQSHITPNTIDPTNTHRSTYPKPNHPYLNQSVPNYDENDFWMDYDYF
jgi:hypothetical protein